MKKKKDERTVQITATILQKDYESLKKLSSNTHKSMSELIRQFVLDGMSMERNKSDIDFIRKNIREEIHIAMDGYMNRLIKLLIRIGTMTITMCFFTSKILYVLVAKYKGDIDYDVMFSDAKKKSAAFLGVRDEAIDEACKKILNERDNDNGI